MSWDTYELVVDEIQTKVYRVRAQSATQARTVFDTKRTKGELKPVLHGKNLTVKIRTIGKIWTEKNIADN